MVKQPPHAIEVEQGVLGTLLSDPESYLVFDLLYEDDFYNPRHRKVYQAAKSLYENKDPVDAISVGMKTGQEEYLLELPYYPASNIGYYCSILKEKSIRRRLILGCSKLISQAYEDESDTYEVLDNLNTMADTVDSGSKARHSLTPSEIEERDKNKPKAEKLFLGYSDMDYGIYGDSMKRGQVELTIADSGHGKTQYALFKAECLLNRGYKIAWFQLEGYDSETSKVFEGLKNQDNIFICDDLYDIEDIKREARLLNREFGIDYIVIDYVQNVECSKNISKTERVEYISQQITRMAKELNAISHPLSQITMNYTVRGGWKQEPGYGDVRWSQQLKQDAHIITSVFRPSRIESLVVGDSVKGWKDQVFPYNSVFVKQAKVRHGPQEWKRLHMIHTEDKGLKPYENPEKNGVPF